MNGRPGTLSPAGQTQTTHEDTMKTTRRFVLPGAILLLLAAILAACGGGGSTSSSGTGSPTSTSTGSGGGSVSGTITGFGSLVVDGQEYTETNGTSYFAQDQAAPAALGADALQLGQQVNLTLDSKGNISQVVVVPEVEGTVTATSTITVGPPPAPPGSATPDYVIAEPDIVVAGTQIVANSGPLAGPVTIFGGGYTSLSSIQVGDNVEVHGVLKSYNTSDYVQATYIGKLPSFVGTRVTGTVSGYDASTASFSLGSVTINASGATIKPDGATLANGEVVSAWSSGSLSSNTLTATRVDVRSNLAVAGDTLAVSGPISNYVSQASFTVNGQSVDASGLTLPSDITALSNGLLVAVSGTVNSSGVLVATKLKVYQTQANAAPPVSLQGSISNFVSASSFTVRGVTVDASQSPTFSNGSASDLANGAYVIITGTISNNVVVASTVSFVSLPSTAVIDVKATVQSYVASSGLLTLSLTLPGGSQTVSLPVTLGSTVTYDNGSASDLTAGQLIEIHAVYTAASNSLSIQTITFLPAPPSTTGNTRPVLLEGVVTAVSPSTGTVTSFVVQGLTVGVGSATVQTIGGASATLAVGEQVAVAATASSGNTLTATRVVVIPAPSFGQPANTAPSGPATSGS